MKTHTQIFSLPLVSVVVVNHNYGRFLQQAVDSVLQQTYPSVECIIVDDASTDESSEVISSIENQYPSVKVLRRTCNGGQSLASKEGFEISQGDYVVFLDADDFLLPKFVETHVFVHLSLRIPVGVTSVNMLQSMDSRIVLGTFYSINKFTRLKQKRAANLFSRIDQNAPDFWPLSPPDEKLEEQLYFFQPRGLQSEWYWAPTSGNCFRRDALVFFLNNERLHELHYSTDAYLLKGVSLLTGSVLIDRSLAIYRMHNMNAFSQHPHLHGILNYEQGGRGDKNRLSNQLLRNHLISNAKFFFKKIGFNNLLLCSWLCLSVCCSVISRRFFGKNTL